MRIWAVLCLFLQQPALGEYADVNGLRMYYELHGQGRPVVLLHGGMNTIQTSFAKQIPVFARNHRVIAMEQMAHGHTADKAGRKLSYEGMAEDTATLLAQLGVRNADLVGWSDGGQVALRMAFTHPQLVRRVVASGVGVGASPEAARMLAAQKDYGTVTAGMFPYGFEEYKRVSPDGPAHWAEFAEKSRAMWSGATWGFTEAELTTISQPVMIVAGDKENIEGTLRVFHAIPKARLCILPGTGHATFQERPEWVNAVVLDFLDRDASETHR